jgi:hypothetical protein
METGYIFFAVGTEFLNNNRRASVSKGWCNSCRKMKYILDHAEYLHVVIKERSFYGVITHR